MVNKSKKSRNLIYALFIIILLFAFAFFFYQSKVSFSPSPPYDPFLPIPECRIPDPQVNDPGIGAFLCAISEIVEIAEELIPYSQEDCQLLAQEIVKKDNECELLEQKYNEKLAECEFEKQRFENCQSNPFNPPLFCNIFKEKYNSCVFQLNKISCDSCACQNSLEILFN